MRYANSYVWHFLQKFHRKLVLLMALGFSGVFGLVQLAQAQPDTVRIVLAIHGGAGTITRAQMTPEREQQYREALRQALQEGYAVLQAGGSSLDAVVAAIRVLEDSPLFNAGRGAVLNRDGVAELDATIMDGRTLKAGAVAGVQTVKNPILLARRVMEATPHVLLIGRAAEAFAQEQGLEIVPNEYFIVPERRLQLQRLREQGIGIVPEEASSTYGTVGAVALDRRGNLAAGTSTGGLMGKLPGRVGDSAIIGAGTYADNATCAVSTTGQGEYFIRGVVAHEIAALMKYASLSVQQAASAAIYGTLAGLGGQGGVIALDRNGQLAVVFNTEGMYRGYVDEHGHITIQIYRD
ncbi:isoaspartyl peptidase/L-asparaginase [Rhodothermus bifroesti]